ncbi:MAG: hypothetical protein ACI4RJ_04325, partial [Alphaproteobacteria bacterium]
CVNGKTENVNYIIKKQETNDDGNKIINCVKCDGTAFRSSADCCNNDGTNRKWVCTDEGTETACCKSCAGGHWYGVSEGSERIGWRCCPDDKWADVGTDGKGQCCNEEGQHVSNGHCCQEGFEWDGEKCALPCNSCQKTVDGVCVNRTVDEVEDEACCTSLYGTTHEWIDDKCAQKCDGYRYALSEGGERVGWGCCPNDKWADATQECCNEDGQHVSNGHCCQEGFEWNGTNCALPCPAERLIEETGECCAEGTKAINGVCCASDTDSEVCCAGMHAAEGEYTLRTYSKYKFCVPKCGECQKFQYENPTTEARAKACTADATQSETCCVNAGRQWAEKESSGKQCCYGTVYNGLCYNKIFGGLCRRGENVPHCSEDLPKGTICQAASYNDSTRKREVSKRLGRGNSTVLKCMQYTADDECKAYGATLIDPDTAQAAYGCYNISSCKVTNYKYGCNWESNHYILAKDGHMEREDDGRPSCWWVCDCEALCVK